MRIDLSLEDCARTDVQKLHSSLKKSVVVKAIHSSKPNKLLTSEYKSWLHSYVNNLFYSTSKEIMVESYASPHW